MANYGIFNTDGWGTLGKDPVLTYMPSGDPVCNFSLACNESWKDKKNGEEKEHTDWLDMSAFGKLAEVMAEHLKKGDAIYFKGRLRQEKWEKDGKKGSKHLCVIKEFTFLPGGNNNNQSGSSSPEAQRQQSQSTYAQAPQQQQAAPQQASPKTAIVGYYFADGQLMTPQESQYYRERKCKPWAKGTPPPQV